VLQKVGGDEQEAVTANGAITVIGLGGPSDSIRIKVVSADGSPVAGEQITWSTNGGGVAVRSTTTDATGEVAARWSWWTQQTGYVPAGTYLATASTSSGIKTTFTGYARVGPLIKSMTISPASVDVSSAAKTVTVTLHVTDDRTGFGVTNIQLVFASAGKPSFATGPTLTSGAPNDGTWQGVMTIPQGTPAGTWTFSSGSLQWGCGSVNGIFLTPSQLQKFQLPMSFTVSNSSAREFPAPRPQQTIAFC